MNSTQQINYHNFIVDTPISKAEKSVLIISNCESTSKRLQAIIQKLNHKCIAVVTNYFKADKIIASQEPDVVIISVFQTIRLDLSLLRMGLPMVGSLFP